MRTTVIPAQITTVEDKIAGSLNLTQIFILMIPVFWTTIVYVAFPPTMHIAWYKLPLILVVLLLSLVLSLRIRGKVVVSWLVVLLRYNLRPKFYLFNKNDAYLREMNLPQEKKQQVAKTPSKKEIRVKASSFNVKDLVKLKAYIQNPNYSLSLKPDKKGGLYVALSEIQK